MLYDLDMKNTIIFDLDGTLADISVRRKLATKPNGKMNWDIFFDPDDIQDINKLQELVDQCCKMLKIKSFTLPKQKIEQFVDLNKIYFDNVVK